MATTTTREGADRLLTEAEFLALPETKTKTELFDGELVCEPSADASHQSASGCIYLALTAWASTRTPRPEVFFAPLDIRFAPNRILQPDLMLFLAPLARPIAMPIARIPDLCVEIVSTRRVYDRVTKRLAYAMAGVSEYWTVIPRLGFLERWTGAGLNEREEVRERLTTPLLPGFALDIPPLLSA